jgi:hypothetical protein
MYNVGRKTKPVLEVDSVQAGQTPNQSKPEGRISYLHSSIMLSKIEKKSS